MGGKDAQRGMIPWQAAIIRPDQDYYHCGATIIDDRHLITDRWCVWSGLIGQKVHAGHVLQISNNATECTLQERIIVHIESHPCLCFARDWCDNFSSSSLGKLVQPYQYYISILTVDRPFLYNKFVQPICLPSTDFPMPEGNMTMTSGFGRNSTLQYSWQPTVPTKVCANRYSWFPDSAICTKHPEGDIGPCWNDRGSPLIVREEEEGRTILIGVFRGGSACDGGPSVYQRVSDSLDWIREKMNNKPVGDSTFVGTEERCHEYLVNQSMLHATASATAHTPHFWTIIMLLMLWLFP